MTQIESLFGGNRIFILDNRDSVFTCIEALYYITCYAALQYMLF